MQKQPTQPQMTLEEYKKKVIDLIRTQSPAYTEEIEKLQRMSDKGWQEYMKDFSPEAMACGIVMNLI